MAQTHRLSPIVALVSLLTSPVWPRRKRAPQPKRFVSSADLYETADKLTLDPYCPAGSVVRVPDPDTDEVVLLTSPALYREIVIEADKVAHTEHLADCLAALHEEAAAA